MVSFREKWLTLTHYATLNSPIIIVVQCVSVNNANWIWSQICAIQLEIWIKNLFTSVTVYTLLN